ncbi:MAG: hypothetical protein ACLP50_16795 [Solirubrobacteraceae bacterium]
MVAVAWIEEDLELEWEAQRPRGSLASGRFTAYLKFDTREDAGPGSVEAEDAIAWGRENASVVIVRVCDDFGGAAHFSAGADAPQDWQVGTLMPWPSGGLQEARRLANRGPEPPAAAEAGLHHVQLIALARDAELSETLVRQIAEWLDAANITVERAETIRRPLDAGTQSVERTPETFWARPLSPPPVAIWTLEVSAANGEDAEAAALRAIGSCAEKLSANALQWVAFRARAVS